MPPPSLHRRTSKRTASWLKRGPARLLLAAVGLAVSGLIGLRLGQSGHDSARPPAVPSGIVAGGANWDPEFGSDGTSSSSRGRSPASSGREGGKGRPDPAGADPAAEVDHHGPGKNGEPNVDELFLALDRLERRIAAAMARARESVVALEYSAADAPDGDRRMATGVVINNGGEILSVRIDPPPTRPAPGTRKDLASIVARDFQGKRHRAQWVAADPETGLTLLRVSASAVRPIRSVVDGPKLGSQVFVVGSPFGMGHSVSRGHVAGLDRAVELNTRQLGGLIQVQAPLYPGDSGAAVVDLRGYWLGLIRGGLAVPGSGSGPAAQPETAPIARTSPSSPRAIAIEANGDPAPAVSGRPDSDTDFGFAIPTRDALWIAGQLSTRGQVDRAYLGVRLDTEGTGAGSVNESGPASAWQSPPGAGTKAGMFDPDIASPTTHPGESEGAPSPAAAGDGAASPRRAGRNARGHGTAAGRRPHRRTRRPADPIASRPQGPPRPHPGANEDQADRRPRPGITALADRAFAPDRQPTGPDTGRQRPRTRPGNPRGERQCGRDPDRITVDSAQAGRSEASLPATPDSPSPARPVPSLPTDPDRTKPATATPSPTASLAELRHTLPRAVVERFEKLERRLEKLETFSAPAGPAPRTGPASTPSRQDDSIRLP